MTLCEFYEKLRKHDWYYCFSDDLKVCEKGEAAEKELKNLANESEAHKKLFDDFKRAVWSHGKEPIPDKPE